MVLHALECQNDERAIAIADSALNRELVTLDELREATRDLPRRYGRAIARADREVSRARRRSSG
jgi:hypothetical protein